MSLSFFRPLINFLKFLSLFYRHYIRGNHKFFSYFYFPNYYYFFRYRFSGSPFRHLSTFHWNCYFSDVLFEHNVNHYLYGGALLGSIRNNNYAGRPADVDYILKTVDAQSIVHALNSLYSRGFRVVNIKVNKGIINIDPPSGSTISLIFYSSDSSGTVDSYIRSFVPSIFYKSSHIFLHPRARIQYDSFSDPPFYYSIPALLSSASSLIYNKSFLVPSNFDSLIVTQYGNNWRIPLKIVRTLA